MHELMGFGWVESSQLSGREERVVRRKARARRGLHERFFVGPPKSFRATPKIISCPPKNIFRARAVFVFFSISTPGVKVTVVHKTPSKYNNAGLGQ